MGARFSWASAPHRPFPTRRVLLQRRNSLRRPGASGPNLAKLRADSLTGHACDHLFRVVAVWNKVERRYQIYVTNVPPHRFTAEQVAASYRLRWTVERFYVAAKSGMGLDRITSRKPHIVKTLIRAALLRCTVAMQAKREAEKQLPPGRWMNPLMWTKVWRSRVGDMLLGRWLNGGRSRDPTTWSRLAQLAMDPDRRRLSPRVLAGWGFSFPWAWQRHSAR